MKNNVGRIVVKAVEADMKSLGDVEGQAVGADGMALVVKGVEGTPAEAVVGASFVGRNVPDEFGARLLGPIGDVDQGDGVGQSCGDQQTEEGAVQAYSAWGSAGRCWSMMATRSMRSRMGATTAAREPKR